MDQKVDNRDWFSTTTTKLVKVW